MATFSDTFSILSDVGGQPCPCPVVVSLLSGKSCPHFLSGVCPDSVCVDFVRCPDPVRNSRKNVVCLSDFVCLDSVCSGFCPMTICPEFFCLDSVRCPDSVEQKLSVVCLRGRTRTRQRCPDFRCLSPSKSAYYGVHNKEIKPLTGSKPEIKNSTCLQVKFIWTLNFLKRGSKIEHFERVLAKEVSCTKSRTVLELLLCSSNKYKHK